MKIELDELMAVSCAYDLLVEIQQACEQNYLKFSSEHAFQWQGVICTVGQQQIVTPIWQMTEIIPMPKVTTIPGLKTFVKGVAQVRGELILLNGLDHFLDEPSSNDTCALIVEKNNEKVGFAVTKVDHLKMIRHQQLMDAFKAPYMKKVVQDGENTYPVVDFKALMEQPSFIQIRLLA